MRAKQKAMVYIPGSMVTDTKVNGSNASGTEMEPTFSQMLTCMWVSTNKESQKALASTNGPMATRTQVLSKVARSTERENGRNSHQISQTEITSTSMKDTTSTTRSTATENFNGNQEISTLETTTGMNDKDMAR